MQRVYTKFSLAVLSLLCSQMYIHTMENPESRVPSLKSICLQYVGEHIDELNVISHLSDMPVEIASGIIWSTRLPVIGEYKDVLNSCIEKKDLNHDILSAIASQLSSFKIVVNKAMNTRLSEITDIMAAFNNGTINLITLIEFNNKVSNFISDKVVLPVKEELTTFIELAMQIHAKQTTISKLKDLKVASMSGNTIDSANKHIERLLASNKELLKKLPIQADICSKEINALQTYALTISIPNLAHAIAKNGPLSFGLAQRMIIDFLSTSIPDSFDDVFNYYFPEDVNDRSLFLALAEKGFCLPVEMADELPVEEFEKQLLATVNITTYPWIEVTYNTNKKDRCIFPGYLTLSDTILTTIINPKHNIFLVHAKENVTDVFSKIVLINTKNMLSFYISEVPADEVKQICLNEDCTQLSIMLKDDSNVLCRVPSEVVSFKPSLKQRAFLRYLQQKSFDVLPMALPDLARIGAGAGDLIPLALFIKQHFKNISLKTFDKFLQLVGSNTDLIPNALIEVVFGKRIDDLRGMFGSIVIFVLAAKQLNLTLEELCDKVISNEIITSDVMEMYEKGKLTTDYLNPEQRAEIIYSFLGE